MKPVHNCLTLYSIVSHCQTTHILSNIDYCKSVLLMFIRSIKEFFTFISYSYSWAPVVYTTKQTETVLLLVSYISKYTRIRIETTTSIRHHHPIDL